MDRLCNCPWLSALFFLGPQLTCTVKLICSYLDGLLSKVFNSNDSIFFQGVDLELWAHEHTYERLWPVYGDKVSYHINHTIPFFSVVNMGSIKESSYVFLSLGI